MEIERFSDLVAGVSEQWICEYLQVNPKTVKRWRTGEVNAPHAIRKLLKIALDGDLSALGGKEWEGFVIGRKDQLMYIPLFHRGQTPRQVAAMFFYLQEAREDKREIKRLQAEIVNLKASADVKKVTGFNATETNVKPRYVAQCGTDLTHSYQAKASSLNWGKWTPQHFATENLPR